MPEQHQSVIERRFDQMFPALEAHEVERLRRFGEVRTFRAGEAVARIGTSGHGLMFILRGSIRVTRRDQAGNHLEIVTHHPGHFMGELAQLAGRPALVDADTVEDVEALVVHPDRLPALFVAEADVGERIMRALILRRVGLLETGAGGPIIVGRANDGD
ncbi:MAG: Crp/Fnr family transcriptional regulator, partial [Xanthobacteraceae bacterium]